MSNLTNLEELEEIILSQKDKILRSSEADITLSFNCGGISDDHHIYIDSLGDIYLPDDLEESFETYGSDINISLESVDNDMISKIIAVFSDALEIEVDRDHIFFTDDFEENDVEDIYSTAEWYINNGFI